MKQLIFITILYSVFGFPVYSQTPCNYNTKGLKEIADSNYQQALADFNLALQYCTDNQDSLIGIYLNRSWAEFALGEYKKSLADDSTATELNIELGQQNIAVFYDALDNDYEQQQMASANNLEEEALLYYKNNKQITERLSYYLGQVYFNLDYYPGATKMYSKCIAIDLNNRRALRQRAEAYKCNNQYKLAIADYNKAISYYKNDAELYLKLGMVYRLMNKKTKAHKAFKKSLQLDTSDVSLLDLYFLGDSATAVKNITDKIHTDPLGKLHHDYYIAACLMAVMNKPDEAIEYLKESIKNGTAKSTLMYNPYFINIRHNPAFVELMKEPK